MTVRKKAASLNFVRADVDGLKGFLRVFTRKGQVNVFGKEDGLVMTIRNATLPPPTIRGTGGS